MRTFLRNLAVVVPLVLLVVLVAVPASAQFRINSFDTAVADSQFAKVFNPSAMAADPKAILDISDDATVKHEGAASLKNVWRVKTTESWGGNDMLSLTLPRQDTHGFYADSYRAVYGDSTYFDWGAGTHLSLWYYTEAPSTAAGNGVQMRFHIYEGGEGSTYYTGDNTDYEDWYFQSPVPLNDTTAGWHELIIPLIDKGKTNAPDATGFHLTDWSGKNKDNKLSWDKIIGYTIEWTAGKVPSDTASGIVYYDDLKLAGLGYKPDYEFLYSFADFTKDTADFNAGWNNGGLSAFDLFNETTDTLMGASVMGVNWKINVKESWGGGTNKEYNMTPEGTFFPDLASKSELQLYVKVVDPLTSSSGVIANKITMRFVLFDYSDGQKEEWYTIANVRNDSVGARMGWQQIRMPLDWIQSNNWGDLKVGRFNTPNGAKDQVLAFNKIGGFKIEFSSSRDEGEPFAADLVYSGKMLFSAVIPAGYRETDVTPPAMVGSVSATPGAFSNIVTWADVPGETGETYTAYVSEKPFTATDEPGVENIPPFGLPHATQIQTHPLIAPNTDQPVTLYYGVTSTDNHGNTNLPSVYGPVTNTAKGVPTISLAPPTTFVADGDLSEWTGVSGWVLSVNPSNPTAHASTNTTITDDADLMAHAYIAVDQTYMYVAFDVDDDVISIDTSASASSWFQDSPDLFIGLYDWRGRHHAAYGHGVTPDYHLRFSQNKVIVDNDGSAIVATPGPDYVFSIKQITTGYVIEARIPWTSFKGASASDSLFSPVEGMRIPIDFELNDNDTPGSPTAREGIMCYSLLNNDNSWADVWRWSNTWIGNKSSTQGVADEQTLANVYKLNQNYPNPFNPSTQISYSIAKPGFVSVKVYDILGREVAKLVNEYQQSGTHVVKFDTATLRQGLASGVFFYRIESGSFMDVRKMMLLK